MDNGGKQEARTPDFHVVTVAQAPPQVLQLKVSRTIRIVTVLALVYSGLHFVVSGVGQPFDHPNLAKFEEQASPLRIHLETGQPVHSTNPEQYGPAFFFVMHPLLRAALDDQAL